MFRGWERPGLGEQGRQGVGERSSSSILGLWFSQVNNFVIFEGFFANQHGESDMPQVPPAWPCT